MNIKLGILLGTARGGEETWNSMYKYLIEPYSRILLYYLEKTQINLHLYIKKLDLYGR